MAILGERKRCSGFLYGKFIQGKWYESKSLVSNMLSVVKYIERSKFINWEEEL